MPVLKAKINDEWVEISTTGPMGPEGLRGRPGPTAVSGDDGNIAELGSDALIYVPGTLVTDEVWVGATPPRDVTTELWYDTRATPGTLNVNVEGEWVAISGLPPGGTTHMALHKRTDADGDVEWMYAAKELPPDGTPGQVLTKAATTDRLGVEWADPTATTLVPDEVFVGVTPPLDPFTELWYDSSSDPGRLQVKVDGRWVEVTSSTEEVVVGYTEPTDEATNLWYDTSKGVPGTLYVRTGGTWVEVVRASTSVHSEYNYGLEPNAGTQGSYARGDHTHGTPPPEVHVGIDDPALTNPDIDLWFDPTDFGPPVVTPPTTLNRLVGPPGHWVAPFGQWVKSASTTVPTGTMRAVRWYADQAWDGFVLALDSTAAVGSTATFGVYGIDPVTGMPGPLLAQATAPAEVEASPPTGVLPAVIPAGGCWIAVLVLSPGSAPKFWHVIGSPYFVTPAPGPPGAPSGSGTLTCWSKTGLTALPDPFDMTGVVADDEMPSMYLRLA